MGYLITKATQIQCSHAAVASIQPSSTRVKVAGAPAATVKDITTVTGCPFATPEPRPSPCMTVEWNPPTAAKRVKIGGQAALLQETVGIGKSGEGLPQGPVIIGTIQARVKGL